MPVSWVRQSLSGCIKDELMKMPSRLVSRIFLTASFLDAVFLSSSLFAETPVIQKIQDLLPAVVSIQSENAQLYKGADKLVGDSSTGRVFVVQPMHVAQYSRKGTGFILDSAGTVVASAHTVENAARVKVIFRDTTELEAKVIALSKDDDVAILRVSPKPSLTVMPLSEDGAVKLYESVYSIGGSDVLKGTIIGGRVIGIGTKNDPDAGNSKDIALLKINFDVYHGDSGDPVINGQGQLIGMTMAGDLSGGRVSLAVHVNRIKKYYLQSLQQPSPQ